VHSLSQAARARGVAAAVICALLAGSGLGLGCTYAQPESELDGLEITAAQLEELRLVHIAAIGGFTSGSATLVVEDQHGFMHELPIELRGETVGLLGSMAVAWPTESAVPLQLPPATITGEQLFGVYSGSYEAFVVPVGIVAHNLRNPFGVELDTALFGFGAEFSVAFEWLSLNPDEDELGDGGVGEDGGADL